jgi:hypothetical protein
MYPELQYCTVYNVIKLLNWINLNIGNYVTCYLATLRYLLQEHTNVLTYLRLAV